MGPEDAAASSNWSAEAGSHEIRQRGKHLEEAGWGSGSHQGRGREGRFRTVRWDFLMSVGPGDLELEGAKGPPVEWPQETAAKLSSLSGF